MECTHLPWLHTCQEGTRRPSSGSPGSPSRGFNLGAKVSTLDRMGDRDITLGKVVDRDITLDRAVDRDITLDRAVDRVAITPGSLLIFLTLFLNLQSPTQDRMADKGTTLARVEARTLKDFKQEDKVSTLDKLEGRDTAQDNLVDKDTILETRTESSFLDRVVDRVTIQEGTEDRDITLDKVLIQDRMEDKHITQDRAVDRVTVQDREGEPSSGPR